MIIEELPFDCFTTYCTVSGAPEDIDRAFADYINRYPYMQYATRIKERNENSAVFVRWTRKEDCIAACVHKPSIEPSDANNNKKQEQGKDHTVFQTNQTLRV